MAHDATRRMPERATAIDVDVIGRLGCLRPMIDAVLAGELIPTSDLLSTLGEGIQAAGRDALRAEKPVDDDHLLRQTIEWLEVVRDHVRIVGALGPEARPWLEVVATLVGDAWQLSEPGRVG